MNGLRAAALDPFADAINLPAMLSFGFRANGGAQSTLNFQPRIRCG